MTSPEEAPDEDLRATLVGMLESDDARAHLVLGWRDAPPAYSLKRVDISVSVAEQFLEYALDAAAALVNDRSSTPYDPEWPLGGHYYFELVGDHIPADSLFASLADFLNLERFDRKLLRKPRLYVVAIQSEGRVAFFGRRMAYLKVLNRQGSGFTAIWDGSTFNDLEASVATFADSFDWIRFEDRMYVLDDKGFHAEFRDSEGLRKAVKDHVAVITAAVAIEGVDAFTARCRASVPMASKLKRVAESGIWSEEIAELKKYAETWNIPVQWNGDALVFDGSMERQWAILKLLDEDGTIGPVSGRHYESAIKRRVAQP